MGLAMFIIGFPTDNEDSIMKTIKYAKKLNTTFSQFSVWTPYPGTPVYQEYKDKMLTKKFEDFNQWKLVFKHKSLSEKSIRRLLDLSYKSYYLRLPWILKYLRYRFF